jgi:trehalose-phosphatase
MPIKIPAKPCLLMLDFDGTLVPIAPKPDAIQVPDDLKALLTRIQDAGHELYIISGRRASEVKDRLTPAQVNVIGLHGLEWKDEPLLKRHPLIDDTLTKLEPLKRKHHNLLIEDKELMLAVHTRAIPQAQLKELEAELLEVLHTQAEQSSTHGEILSVLSGLCVLELRPKSASKALAVERLMAEYPDLHPIYIGDDTTDEEAFGAMPNSATSIRVGTQGATRARFRLENVSDVYTLLESLAKPHIIT